MRKGKTYDVLSIQGGNGNDGTKYLGKAKSPKNKKKKNTNKRVPKQQLLRRCVWLSGLIMHVVVVVFTLKTVLTNGLGGANPAVNTPRPSRGTRIESCDFIVLIGDP